MWQPVALPFKDDSLPERLTLPTTDDTRTCPDVLWERNTAKVVAINDQIVAKFGGSINPQEGQALIYLERYVPERAPGAQLDSIWPSLTEPEKDDIIAKLRRTFEVMRQAKCPWPDFFGSLDGGSLYHYLFYSQSGDQNFLGPFYGEAAFVAGLTGNFRALIDRNSRADFKARFYETYLPRVLQGHRPTLTHGDVQQKNIMANSSGQNDQGERSFDVVLIDWEHAGWYPNFWEFFCASSPFIFAYWEEDCCWRAQEFLEVWPAEMAMMRMVDKDHPGF